MTKALFKIYIKFNLNNVVKNIMFLELFDKPYTVVLRRNVAR